MVRIDDFFKKRANLAYEQYSSSEQNNVFFEGVAFGTFDGILKEVDLRGTVASAKLILTVGKVELNCICNSVTVDNLRMALDKRVSVFANAHYGSRGRLPERVEIRKIEILDGSGDLSGWRGAFNLPYPRDEDIW